MLLNILWRSQVSRVQAILGPSEDAAIVHVAEVSGGVVNIGCAPCRGVSPKSVDCI